MFEFKAALNSIFYSDELAENGHSAHLYGALKPFLTVLTCFGFKAHKFTVYLSPIFLIKPVSSLNRKLFSTKIKAPVNPLCVTCPATKADKLLKKVKHLAAEESDMFLRSWCRPNQSEKASKYRGYISQVTTVSPPMGWSLCLLYM